MAKAAKSKPKRKTKRTRDPGMPSRDRKVKFVLEYLKDLKGEAAAIRAGIPEAGARTQATRLLKDVEVRAMITEHQARMANRYDLDHAKIIRDVLDIGETALTAGNYASALKSKEMAGRHVGMWPNRWEVAGPNGGPIPVMAATVVLRPEDLTPKQRSQLKEIMLKAKAKELAASQAAPEEE